MLQDKRQTEDAVGMLLQENHSLHQQVSGTAATPPTASTATVANDGSEIRDQSAHGLFKYTPPHRFQHLKSDSMVSPRAALQSMFPGKLNGYDHSPDNSSQADSYDLQYPPQQQPQHYYGDYSQSGSPGSALGQLGQLRSELALKDEQIVQLQHTVQGLRSKLQSLQYTVDDADAHRRQVQVHNGELQTQIDSLLAEMEGLRQGQSWGGDANYVHQLTQANLELNSQLTQLSQRLETQDVSPQGHTEQESSQLLEKIAQLESEKTDLDLKLSQVESQLRHDHHRELRKIESEKENRLLELKGEHETLISLLTEQNERLEAELKDAAETARTAATAAATSPITSTSASGAPSTPRGLTIEDEKKVQGLKATILQLVEENKSLTRTHEHNRTLKQEVCTVPFWKRSFRSPCTTSPARFCICFKCLSGREYRIPWPNSELLWKQLALPLQPAFAHTYLSFVKDNLARIVKLLCQVQQMMKVKSEREDLRQENSKLQSDLRKLQRELDAKAAPQPDQKLQEQLHTLQADKEALQEQVQQQRAAPAGPAPLQAGLKKDGQEGYQHTWKLVDQLRNQNRHGDFSLMTAKSSHFTS